MLKRLVKQGNQSFARGKLQKKKRENIERKREAGNDRRKRKVSGQNGRVGIADFASLRYTLLT